MRWHACDKFLVQRTFFKFAIDMLTFDNKFDIGSEVSAIDMAGTFVVVAIFPRLLDNGSQYISYLCAPKGVNERFWYFREEELLSLLVLFIR